MDEYVEEPGDVEMIRVIAAGVESAMMRRPRLRADDVLRFFRRPIVFETGMYQWVRIADEHYEEWFSKISFRISRNRLTLYYNADRRLWLDGREHPISQSEAERLAGRVFCSPYIIQSVSDEAIRQAKQIVQSTRE